MAAGDRFYFKLDGVDDIEGDATDWSPSLSYVDTCAPPQPCQPVNHAARDVYGLPAFDFGRASDFRLANPQVPGFAASVVGTVKVTGTLRRASASDGVTVRFLKNDTLLSQTAFGPSDPTEKALSVTVDVAERDQLTMDTRTGAGVDPGHVTFDPVVEYSRICRDEGDGPICRDVVSCDETRRRCTLADTDPVFVALDLVRRPAEVQNSGITVAPKEPMAGGFRGWYVAEWNGNMTFAEAKFNESRSDSDRRPANFTRMLPRRLGIKRDRPLPIDVPGPAWMGAGADSYALPTAMKPSRIAGMKPSAGRQRSGHPQEQGLQQRHIRLRRRYCGTERRRLDRPARLPGPERRSPARLDQLQHRTVPGAGGLRPGTPLGMTFGSLRAIDNHNLRFGFSLGSGASAIANKLNAGGTTKAIVSVLPSFGLHYGRSTTSVDFVDVNGDGLPDHVYKVPGGPLTVQLNLGYGFGSPSTLDRRADPAWGEDITTSTNDVVAALMPTISGDFVRAQDNATNSLEIGYAGIGGGISYSVSRTLAEYVDINGDGLAESGPQAAGHAGPQGEAQSRRPFPAPRPWTLPGWTVPLERRFTKEINGSNDALAFNENVSFHVGIGVPIPIELLVVCIMIEISEQIGLGTGSSQLAFEDVDGDGKADHVLKKAGDQNIYVKLNQTGKANLLKRVTRPLGATISLDYARQGNHVDVSNPDLKVDMPRNQWVLASVQTSDALGSSYLKTFEYGLDATDPFGSGFHDRVEREDYGFAHVRTIREDFSTVDEYFHNQDYYRRGMLRQTVERDNAGRLFRIVETDYDAPSAGTLPRTGQAFPAERQRRTFFYEGTTTDPTAFGKVTRESRDYDAIGNLTSFTDEGDSEPDDDVSYGIDYYRDPTAYIFRPSSLVARDVAGNVLRERTSSTSPPARCARSRTRSRAASIQRPARPTTERRAGTRPGRWTTTASAT